MNGRASILLAHDYECPVRDPEGLLREPGFEIRRARTCIKAKLTR
jgi:hypothetical protein